MPQGTAKQNHEQGSNDTLPAKPSSTDKGARAKKGRLSGSSYAGMNRIKFAGLINHLSAITAHPGQFGVYTMGVKRPYTSFFWEVR